MPPKSTLVQFIAKAISKHGNRYDYSSVVYLNAITKVLIVCQQHGSFWQLPSNHIAGVGCPLCGNAQRRKPYFTTEHFVSKAKEVHAEKYDYSKVTYKGHNQKVEIICSSHGSFWQRANNHLAGIGCNRCGRERTGASLCKSLEEFIASARAIHGDRYDYTLVKYAGAFRPVDIVCPRHGVFSQTADAHTNTGAGCPRCVSRYSRGHREIEEFLTFLGVSFSTNNRTIISPYELDTWLPSHKLAIEFNGRYHGHSLDGTEPPSTKYKHRDKFLLCQKQGVHLLQVDEHEWCDFTKQKVWKSIIASKLGKHSRKVYARNTEFRPVAKATADSFLETNHLQGKSPSSNAVWCFGLYLKEELVGVITFSNHEKTSLNLTRMAFPLWITVVGGAQKLFTNALKRLPKKCIVTFSHNRYSTGAVYRTLGFEKHSDLQPSYQWYFRGKVQNKRLFRHSRLAKVLGSAYDPKKTEMENMYAAGARCLYDAGYQRWVFSPV
jgi:hypothetical protein